MNRTGELKHFNHNHCNPSRLESHSHARPASLNRCDTENTKKLFCYILECESEMFLSIFCLNVNILSECFNYCEDFHALRHASTSHIQACDYTMTDIYAYSEIHENEYQY